MGRKRGQNEGSVYQRTDGRWVAVMNLGFEGGRRQRKYWYGATAADVQRKLLDARSDYSRGLPVIVEKESVAGFLDHWLEDSVKPSVRPLTYEQYRQHVRLYISPALGRHPLAKLMPDHVQAFVNRQTKKGLSPRTAQLSLVILRHALEQAVRWNLIGRNVAKLATSPKVRRFEIKPLGPEQARALLDNARGERLEALYSVALALGLRQGEALGLRWQDVDLDARKLAVRQTLERIGGKRFGQLGKLEFVEPKTDRSRRTLIMPASIVSALRAHRARQLQERLIAGSRWQDKDLIFTTTIGTPIEPRSVVLDFKRILKKAGLPTSTRFHDLRHSAASLLLAQGIDMRVIMEVLGHSTIALTANTYSHIMSAAMREAAERMEAILG